MTSSISIAFFVLPALYLAYCEVLVKETVEAENPPQENEQVLPFEDASSADRELWGKKMGHSFGVGKKMNYSFGAGKKMGYSFGAQKQMHYRAVPHYQPQMHYRAAQYYQPCCQVSYLRMSPCGSYC